MGGVVPSSVCKGKGRKKRGCRVSGEGGCHAMTSKSLAKFFKKNNKRGELVVLMPPYLMKRKGGWREDGKCPLKKNRW
jgi:hypothetical protein